MAGNDWINSYLEAILDVGPDLDDAKSSLLLRERGRFSRSRYFVEEIINGFDETDLHRSWLKLRATRSPQERSTRLENMCWRIWNLARQEKQPDKPRVDDEDDEEGTDGDNEVDMDREVDEATDVRGKASGDKFYKSEGNEKFHSGAGAGGSSGSGSNAEGESEDSEEEFCPIIKYDEVIKEAEARGVHLPHDMVEAAKSVGIHKSHLLRYLDLQVGLQFKAPILEFASAIWNLPPEPDEPRADDEDDEEGFDEDNEDDEQGFDKDNEDGMDREAADRKKYGQKKEDRGYHCTPTIGFAFRKGADVRGNASGDKFYKTEGNGKFPIGAGGGGCSGSGSNVEGEREDREEDFGTFTKFYEMAEDDKNEEDSNEDSDDEVDETSLPHEDIEVVMKLAAVSRSKAVKALKAADGDPVSAICDLFPEPDEPRVDDEDDKGGVDEENEDGADREAAEAIKDGEMHGMDNLKGQRKKVRRAGSHRTRAKVAMRKQREAVQPTSLLAGLKNHPSMYVRLGQVQELPHPSAFQDTWTSAFEVSSTAAVVYKKLLHEAGFGDFLRIQPFKIRSGGYTSTLVERYFSETHTLHLGTFEIGPTPLAWTMITGIRFKGDPLNPPDITTQECAKLLGGMEEDFSFIKGKLDLNVLCPSGLDFSKDPTDSDREWMFRRLIVYLVGSCFFSGTDLMVPIRLVSAMSNIRKINQYDWGAATFSAFLRGMRQKTSECCGTFSGFYPFLLLWAYEHIPYMRPLAKSGADTFPLACRWDFTQKDVPIPNDFIWHRLELEYIEDEVNFEPYKELWKKNNFPHERGLSLKRVAFMGLESWELYMGERNTRRFGGRIRIPRSPPAKRFCEKSENFTIDHKLLLGENAWGLLENVGCDYVEWFRTNSLGRIVAFDQFQGRILGGRLIELWLRVYRDGYKVISPQDLQTLQDGAKKWEDKYQIAEAKLKKTLAESNTLREDVNNWKQVAMSLAAERDFWQNQASDAKARLMTSLVPYPTQTSLFHPEEMVPFPRGYMNPYYGDAQNFFMRLD